MILRYRNIVQNLLIASFFVSSFDIFLNFKVMGFSFRLFYFIVMLAVIVGIYSNIIRHRRILIPFKFEMLLLIFWVFSMFVFAFDSDFIPRTLGYAFWLLMDVLVLYLFLEFVKTPKEFLRIFRYYIYSFAFVGMFGLIQFVAGLFGFPILTTQWWIYGHFPRVNGFSYEPSYFATYMMIGFTLSLCLLVNAKFFEKIFNKKSMWMFFNVNFVSIMISSSRMGIFLLVVLLSLVTLALFIKDFWVLKVRRLTASFIVILFVIQLIVLMAVNSAPFLLSGTGLFGLPTHSKVERLKGMKSALKVFEHNPVMGVSLGGVAVENAKLHGSNPTNNMMVKQFEVVNVWLEVLAASGMFMFIVFCFFILTMFYKLIRICILLKRNKMYVPYYIGTSLGLALIVEFLILSLNQNILRPYVWTLIGLCLAFVKLWSKEVRIVEDDFSWN